MFIHFSAFYPTFCSFILHFLQFQPNVFRMTDIRPLPKVCFKRCQTAIFPMHRTAEQGRST